MGKIKNWSRYKIMEQREDTPFAWRNEKTKTKVWILIIRRGAYHVLKEEYSGELYKKYKNQKRLFKVSKQNKARKKAVSWMRDHSMG